MTSTTRSTGNVLVTGGAGYIGSHACVALATAGYSPVIVDNFRNSRHGVLARLEKVCGFPLDCHEADIRDRDAMARILDAAKPVAVMHFAGLKAVGESVAQPLMYYDNNVGGTVHLLEAMNAAGVRNIVFSSSATVYGDPDSVPITESAAVRPVNPYGRSKAMVEQALLDLCASDPRWRAALLRYFNPVGAHPSGLMGEDPQGIPNNLMPFVTQVAVGRQPALRVFGDDYPTPDGTGVRDYIHVMDLAEGHVAALRYMLGAEGAFTVNLGTGRGHSVREVVAAFERACGKPVPTVQHPRRPGDIATCYADTEAAARLLGWRANRSLDDMCADSWRWQSGNPQGYPER